MGRKFRDMQTEEQRYASGQGSRNSGSGYRVQETEPTDYVTAAHNSHLRAEAKKQARAEEKRQAKEERRATRKRWLF